MKEKFTKGKWTIEEAYSMVKIKIKNSTIANVFQRFNEKKPDISRLECIANAQLIAASPLLYEACKAIMEARNERKIAVDGKEYKALQLVDKAILKAQGEEGR